MTFDQFWNTIAKLGSKGGVCRSQRQGADVEYRVDGDRLVYKSKGSTSDKWAITTRKTAEKWFEKLTKEKTNPKEFRYSHSAWFHDMFISMTTSRS
jgi:hypothetical protein